jgi:hypothetical protein
MRGNGYLIGTLLCCVAVLAAPVYGEGISGTYVGKGVNLAVLVQIVESPDRHLTGRYEQIALQPDGKLNEMNAVLTGLWMARPW